MGGGRSWFQGARKRAGSFLGLATNPELACEVTLQPLARYPLDAAILFSDILMIPKAMGVGLSFAEGEGPRIERPVRSAADVAALEQRHQQGALQVLRYGVHGLRDPDRRRRLALLVDHHRVREHFPGELGNRRWHGGAEKHRLPLGGQVLEHLADVGQETHVEHPVNFVEYQVFDTTQIEIALLKVIDESSRCGDNNIRLSAQSIGLIPVTYATVE